MTSPVIEPLDAERFRQELAGLIERHEGDHEPSDFSSAAVQLCIALAEQFNRDSLDPLTLWDRISSGIIASAAKVDDGDLDRFLSLCLEHVKAAPASTACSESVARLVAMLDEPVGWRIGFVKHLVSHHYAVIVHGRQAWLKYKDESK